MTLSWANADCGVLILSLQKSPSPPARKSTLPQSPLRSHATCPSTAPPCQLQANVARQSDPAIRAACENTAAPPPDHQSTEALSSIREAPDVQTPQPPIAIPLVHATRVQRRSSPSRRRH